MCQSQQRSITKVQEDQLKQQVEPPENLGIQLVVVGQQKSARWKEMSSPAAPVVVPLLPPDSPHSVQPMVNARINHGNSVALVIDTGAPITLIHARAAIANKVRVADPAHLKNFYKGLGGNEEAYYGMIDFMSIDELQFRNVFTAIRLERYEKKAVGMPVVRWEGNLIGMSSLFRFAYITIDYAGRKAVFSSREYFEEPEETEAHRLPFKLESMQVRMGVKMGTNELVAMVDSGNDASLMLSTNIVAQLGLTELAAKGKISKFVGLGGEWESKNFSLPQVEIGGLLFTNIAAVTAPEGFDVVLGSGFLKDYKTTFDFRRKALWLEQPGASEKEIPAKKPPVSEKKP